MLGYEIDVGIVLLAAYAGFRECREFLVFLDPALARRTSPPLDEAGGLILLIVSVRLCEAIKVTRLE